MFLNTFKNTLNNLYINARENAFYGSLITVLAYIYGLVSTPLFWVLIFFSFFDYLIGIYASFVTKKFNLDTMLEGIIKKMYVGIIIVISALIDFSLSYLGVETMGIFHNFIMATLLGRELGSLVKNANRGKLWVPQLFKDIQKTLEDYGRKK